MKFKWPCFTFITLFFIFSPFLEAQEENPAKAENQVQSLEDYMEEYRIMTLDFKKKDLYNYYLEIFLRVVREKDESKFEKDLATASRFFLAAPNLKPKERLEIIKIIMYAEETRAQSKKRIENLYDTFSNSYKGFAQMMSEEIFIHLDKLQNDQIKYITTKGILNKTVRANKDDNLLELYCRILVSRGLFKSCFELLDSNRDVIKPQTFENLQIETLLYEGEVKVAKTLLDSAEADFKCEKELTTPDSFIKRKLVAIYLRIAGEFKTSLDCLTALEKSKEAVFYYYYEGMKAARLLDKNTADYLFKKAAQFANRRASKYLNTLLDWEEIKNAYFQEKLKMSSLNEAMNTLETQYFRPSYIASDNLKQNITRKGDELIKHTSLKYLELLDIYWLVTLKDIELKRRKKKK